MSDQQDEIIKRQAIELGAERDAHSKTKRELAKCRSSNEALTDALGDAREALRTAEQERDEAVSQAGLRGTVPSEAKSDGPNCPDCGRHDYAFLLHNPDARRFSSFSPTTCSKPACAIYDATETASERDAKPDNVRVPPFEWSASDLAKLVAGASAVMHWYGEDPERIAIGRYPSSYEGPNGHGAYFDAADGRYCKAMSLLDPQSIQPPAKPAAIDGHAETGAAHA